MHDLPNDCKYLWEILCAIFFTKFAFYISGDDMFATFSMVSAKDGMIWGFSRLYLYLFVIIFIYVAVTFLYIFYAFCWKNGVAPRKELTEEEKKVCIWGLPGRIDWKIVVSRISRWSLSNSARWTRMRQQPRSNIIVKVCFKIKWKIK